MTSQYFRIFRWHVLRYLRRHPLLGLLNILSVGLGVAVYLATQIANQSANRAFAASVDLVAGKAELEITAPAGHLPETVLPQVGAVPGVSAATPVVHGFISLPDFPGDYLEVIGIDVFTNGPFRTFDPSNFDAAGFDIQRWLGNPDSIAVSEEFVKQHHLKAGDKIRARVGAAARDLEIGFLLRRDEAFDPHLAAMDIGWAQKLFGRRGELSVIQLKLANARERESTITALHKFLPKDVRVAPPVRRTEEVDKMLGGFELNLTMMSLVSVLVGMFLIYNTVAASVVRRQHEIGILRSLGVTRNEIRSLFLGEAVILGAVGSFLGLVGGVVLARVLVGAVSETISSLYVLVSVRGIALRPLSFALAWIIGVGSVIASAWFPADAAAKQDPVEALHSGTRLERSVNPSFAWLVSGLGCVFLAALFSYLALSFGPRWLSFGAAFLVLAGFSFFVPRVMFHFSKAAGKLLRQLRSHGGGANIETALAAENLSRALFRNSVTVAALAVAVAMTVGVSVMVFSFRKTVEAWINDTLIADLFVTPASNAVAGVSSFFPLPALEFLSKHPDVETIDTYRQAELPMGETDVSAAIVRGGERRQFQFLHGERTELMRRFRDEPCVFASESFARRFHLHEGDLIELTTPDGPHPFAVAALFYDYTNDQGYVYLSANNFARFWHDDRVNSVAVYLKENHRADELTKAFRAEFSRDGQFVMVSNQSLRRRVFEIFDQTFAVTHVLTAIALFVAITGIFLSLTILITERQRELAIVRALGATAGQIRKLLLSETAMLGVLAAAVGIVSGICLSIVLTGVINRAFFGWTIHLAFPWRTLLFTPIWILAAALIAGVVPAWRASRMVLADNLRDE
ncbi:MAG TPA: FtsX-like permease family protein [Chthoniobacterales bacterium]|nr:FtsX-like permease family protein [Chthoniobacterales bacterium]